MLVIMRDYVSVKERFRLCLKNSFSAGFSLQPVSAARVDDNLESLLAREIGTPFHVSSINDNTDSLILVCGRSENV